MLIKISDNEYVNPAYVTYLYVTEFRMEYGMRFQIIARLHDETTAQLGSFNYNDGEVTRDEAKKAVQKRFHEIAAKLNAEQN